MQRTYGFIVLLFVNFEMMGNVTKIGVLKESEKINII
jgi:hypothetical protein